VSDAARSHRDYAPTSVGFAALTVSDSRTAETDSSGDAVRRRVEGSPHRWVGARIVVDEVPAVESAVHESLQQPDVDVLVISGGTGFAPRDVTVEAVEPLLERTVVGFGELFRHLSWAEIGAAAMLSRATAGTIGRQAVFVLPGSPAAVELAMTQLILPEAAHLVGQLRRRS